jgi:hypothetical protein
MKELIFAVFVTLCLFGLVYYQTFRDRQRWKRIASGMSLFGERENIPPLVLEGRSFEPHERRVLIIWGNLDHTGYETMHDAKIAFEKSAGKERSQGARFFAWDGESWKQRK